MESPLVTAFLLLLKWLDFSVPDGFQDLFQLFEHVSDQLFINGYATDLLMDPNPSSYNGGKGTPDNSYDFIIVGGGTAGSLLAMRLADKYKILLLEAGAEPTFLANAPMFNSYQWTSNATNWNYHSIPQRDSCIACRKKKVKYLNGKGLGGTMILGNSIYSRGNPEDYDQWANLTLDASWSYEKLIKHFKKTENYRGKYEDSSSHGFSGMLKVNTQSFQPLSREWVEAGLKMKIEAKDYNEKQTQTFSPVEVTVNEGKRLNTYTQFLKKETWRKTLKITRYAYVERVVLDHRYKAKGVIYYRNSKKIEVRATKEVILCAGVFNTPKILMLSGLGPEQHLRDMSVKLKKNLEHVGKNLQDQPSTMFGPITIVHDKSFLPRKNLTYSVMLEYHLNQSGALGSNLISGIAFYSTPSVSPTYPNIQFTLVPLGIDSETHKMMTKAFGFKQDYFQKFLKDNKDNDAVWSTVTLARPKSRGTVKLKSNNWSSAPVIDPHYYDDPQDMVDMVDGISFIQKVFEQSPWSSVDAKLTGNSFPGCERFKIKSPRYYECLANHFTYSVGNVGGTCRMGSTPEDSVVNNKLLVHKVKRLRIVDASVFPVLPNGGAGTATIMLAEKAAEMILQKWELEVARHRDKSSEGET